MESAAVENPTNKNEHAPEDATAENDEIKPESLAEHLGKRHRESSQYRQEHEKTSIKEIKNPSPAPLKANRGEEGRRSEYRAKITGESS